MFSSSSDKPLSDMSDEVSTVEEAKSDIQASRTSYTDRVFRFQCISHSNQSLDDVITRPRPAPHPG